MGLLWDCRTSRACAISGRGSSQVPGPPRASTAFTILSISARRSGIQGVMTDYEEKFHLQGYPINRCVATMGELKTLAVGTEENADDGQQEEEQ